MLFRFIGIKETVALVKSLKLNKSSHVDSISMKYLRDGLLITVTELCHILNESVKTMRMPSSWKKATITPVPKNGQSKHMVDYRPISVLPAPSKIIERAIYNQLVYHLESHGLLDNRQHGFGKDHSTSSAIYTLTQYIYESLDRRNYVCCVYIDYSKAFDTLDHGIFCKKFRHFGLNNTVIEWCRDYLRNREQCVKVDESVSAPNKITYGVPQGSILGPLFFIMYVNDIICKFKETDPNIYSPVCR